MTIDKLLNELEEIRKDKGNLDLTFIENKDGFELELDHISCVCSEQNGVQTPWICCVVLNEK